LYVLGEMDMSKEVTTSEEVGRLMKLLRLL
jgi:hypothetical protein